MAVNVGVNVGGVGHKDPRVESPYGLGYALGSLPTTGDIIVRLDNGRTIICKPGDLKEVG